MMSKFVPQWLKIGIVGLSAIAFLGACNTTDTAETTEPDTTVEPAEMEEDTPMDETAMMDEETIVAVATESESFSTLAQAIEAAGLADTLAADGPFTVFAPTDEAFAALPEGTLDSLLLPENQETLTQILTYHVIPAEVMAADVTAGAVDTVAGTPLEIMVDDATGNVMVNGANVVQTDISASNGVIHAIDEVLLPPDVEL
ncbi:MAG: fasciclin domain-containing protein [Spirulinaceae cyanobacterium]